MITIQRFTFNTFMVNTYLLFDETGECAVIDPACYEEREKELFSGFLADHKLNVVKNIYTHCHIDHILGMKYVTEKYAVLPQFHPDSGPFFVTAKEIAASFGYTLNGTPAPGEPLSDGQIVRFGNAELKVLFTPGHADGSVCFYNTEEKFVITGDVLFRDTIGRTDLPSGDFDLLMKSIHTQLFTLPDDTVVYPGHGPETTIGYEKENNPFIR
jgi:hydroxyacylglutathione hydrolase